MRREFAIYKHIIIALLCLLVAIAATFSWFNRNHLQTGNNINFERTMNVDARGADCSFETYVGVADEITGMINYDEKLGANFNGFVTEPDGKTYFKTVISNDSSEYSAMVSLFLEGVTVTGFSSGDVNLILSNPLHTVNPLVTSTSTQIIGDVFIKEGESTSVYWYIYVDESSTASSASISFNGLKLTYN